MCNIYNPFEDFRIAGSPIIQLEIIRYILCIYSEFRHPLLAELRISLINYRGSKILDEVYMGMHIQGSCSWEILPRYVIPHSSKLIDILGLPCAKPLTVAVKGTFVCLGPRI